VGPFFDVDAELETLLRRLAAWSHTSVTQVSPVMRHAAKFKPGNAEEQAELVAFYQASLHIKRQLDAGVVPRRQLSKAREQARRGDQVLDHLLRSNFRLVEVIARDLAIRRYPSRDRVAELLPDLVNDGYGAFIEAAQKYDPSRSPHFPSYAARAVRDRIRSSLAQQAPVRMPSAWSRIQRIARKTIPDLAEVYGRPPTTTELQAELESKCRAWARERLTDEQRLLPCERQEELMTERLRKQGMLGAIQRVEEILKLGQTSSSLNAPVGDGESTVQDFLTSDDDSGLFDPVELEELRVAMRSALSSLPEREQKIIGYRYGFFDGTVWTYDRIKDEFGVTAERIRQIEKAALSKLANPAGQHAQLSTFLPGQFEWE
jgi:RNA polymerase sigma factor (sigma-70 family)